MNDVEPAVVVDVDELHAPPEIRPGGRGDARRVAAIAEHAGRPVLVQRVVVVREVGDDEIGKAVAVVVAGIDAHAGLRPAVAAQRRARDQSLLDERPVFPVSEQQVRHRVVGHVDVRPAIVIEIGEDHAEAVVARIDDAGRGGDVAERAVAVVAVEHVGVPGEPLRAAEDVGRHEPAVGRRAARGDRRVVELHVVGDVEVEIAVAVVVGERAARAPSPLVDAGVARDVGEGRLPGVVPQHIGAEGGDVDVLRSHRCRSRRCRRRIPIPAG